MKAELLPPLKTIIQECISGGFSCYGKDDMIWHEVYVEMIQHVIDGKTVDIDKTVVLSE